MSGRVVIGPKAVEDIESAFTYLSRENVAAAVRFLAGVEVTFEALAGMSGMGAMIRWQSARLKGIRVFPVSRFRKYLVFYRVIARGIEVVRVLHRSRDIESVFLGQGLKQ